MNNIIGSVFFGICVGLLVYIVLQEMVFLPLPLVLLFHTTVGFILAYLIFWVLTNLRSKN